MFEPIPGDWRRSQVANFGLRHGLQVGEVLRAVAPVCDQKVITRGDWSRAWERWADQQLDIASEEESAGFQICAGERVLRATTGLYLAQMRLNHRPRQLELLERHWAEFRRGMKLAALGYSRVEVPAGQGVMPGWWLPGSEKSRAPAMIFYPGPELDKELLVMTLRDEFRRRGIGVLVLDGPGIGEAIWLQGMPSRPDYEVPTRWAMEFLRSRDDVDGTRIGVAGISLGGFYATRAAAFEPSLKCCASWGGLMDWAQNVRSGMIFASAEAAEETRNTVKAFVGLDDWDSAIDRLGAWNLSGVLHNVQCPFLLLHGETDRLSPLPGAKQVFREVGSADKTLRVYTAGEGGSEHCQVDEPWAARDLLCDWSAVKLG